MEVSVSQLGIRKKSAIEHNSAGILAAKRVPTISAGLQQLDEILFANQMTSHFSLRGINIESYSSIIRKPIGASNKFAPGAIAGCGYAQCPDRPRRDMSCTKPGVLCKAS